MGGAIAQELAIGYPSLVRSMVLNGTWSSPDAYLRRVFGSWIAAARDAASERDLLEAFFLWIYTARAHADGSVDRWVGEPATVGATAASRRTTWCPAEEHTPSPAIVTTVTRVDSNIGVRRCIPPL